VKSQEKLKGGKHAIKMKEKNKMFLLTTVRKNVCKSPIKVLDLKCLYV
jgi:hypothetical protein